MWFGGLYYGSFRNRSLFDFERIWVEEDARSVQGKIAKWVEAGLVRKTGVSEERTTILR